MSVASRNPFALLDDESPSVAPQKSAPAPAPAAATKDAQKPRNTPASRGGKYYNRGGGGKPLASRDNNAGGIEEPVEGQKKFDGPPRGRGRGRGARGGAGGRGGDRPSRGRQHDRRSQTGIVESEKQTHQSWGGDDGVQELQIEEQAVTDAAVEAAEPTADEPADGEARQDRPPRREREPEEEDNTLTLDQYLAQKKENDVIPKLAGTRQANDGAEDDAWKNTVQLQKSEEEEAYFVGKTKATPKSRAKKEEKVYLEIDARFERPSRGRGGPGDRGGERRGARGGGRGGRGANRGAANGRNAAAVDVGDESAFPSLS